MAEEQQDTVEIESLDEFIEALNKAPPDVVLGTARVAVHNYDRATEVAGQIQVGTAHLFPDMLDALAAVLRRLVVLMVGPSEGEQREGTEVSRRKLRFLRALGKEDTRESRSKRWTVVLQAGGELEKIQPRGAVSTGEATRWDPEHHSRLPGVASYLPVTVGLGERKQELWSKWSKNGGGRR